VRYGDAGLYEVADRFCALAAELGHHPVTLAVAWVAANPAVTSVLVGGRSVEQLGASLAAMSLELDAETRARISALVPEPPSATDRNEEGSSHNYGSR
jgi:aryl-alcohol dehydrogenase-like predicted oxidoreductase